MPHPTDDALRPAVRSPQSDSKRKTPRLPHRETVRFHKPYEFEGTTVDIGAGGAGVEVPLPIANGVAVVMDIFHGHAIAQGTVRWGLPYQDRYRIGIQFQEEDWSIIARVQALGGLKA